MLAIRLKFTAYRHQRSKNYHGSAKTSFTKHANSFGNPFVFLFAWLSALSMTGNPSQRDMNETSALEEFQTKFEIWRYLTIRLNTGQNIMKSVTLPSSSFFIAFLWQNFKTKFEILLLVFFWFSCFIASSRPLSVSFLTANDNQSKAIWKFKVYLSKNTCRLRKLEIDFLIPHIYEARSKISLLAY